MAYTGGATPVNQFYTEASSTVRNKAGSAVAAGPLCYLKGVTINPSANTCLLYTSPSPRDRQKSRMPSSA